jgi:hypothetical protein
MDEVTEVERRRKILERLKAAHESLFDTLDGLRNGTLTKQQADAIQGAIDEEMRVLQRDAGLY